MQYEQINKMLDEITSPLPNQEPAMECVILLRSGKEAHGSLSRVQYSGGQWGLRMLIPTEQRAGGVSMLEMFFDYADVEAIAVKRDVAAKPRVVT